MSYHDLSGSTLTDDERRAEADRILEMIKGNRDLLTLVETGFVDKVARGGPVSIKILFWLRDIKDRIL